jgi:hypothetical protein
MERLSPAGPFSIQGIPDPRGEGKEKQGPGDHSELLAQTRAFKVTVCDLEERTRIGVFTRDYEGREEKTLCILRSSAVLLSPHFACIENGD